MYYAFSSCNVLCFYEFKKYFDWLLIKKKKKDSVDSLAELCTPVVRGGIDQFILKRSSKFFRKSIRHVILKICCTICAKRSTVTEYTKDTDMNGGT